MPAIEVNGKDLLDVVKRMPPEEFDAFIEQALAMRAHGRAKRLSAEESKLIERINRALPAKLSKRYAYLAARLRKGALSATDHQELLQLTHEAESQDADRAAALLELAELRRIPMRTLMKQMGIEPPAAHG